MFVLGVDAHKKSHTLVAVDGTGRARGEKTVPATTEGNHRAILWARKKFGNDLLWAVEDVRSLTARLECELLDADEAVVRVPPQLMARTRKSARVPGKSDPVDALAVARAALREPDLPVATHTPWTRKLKLLLDRREDLVHHRSAMVQRLRWKIHELDPTYEAKPGALSYSPAQQATAEMLEGHEGLLAKIAGDELTDIVDATSEINTLKRELKAIVSASAPSLLALPGCSTLTAARIMGEAADVSRFKSEASFARWAGVAPIPDSSGSTQGRLRRHRGGNRKVNSAIHIIALTQTKKGARGEAYYRKVRARKGSHGPALLALKRHIARSIYTRLRADDAGYRASSLATP